ENHHAAADRNVGLIRGLAKRGDEVDGILDAGKVFALDAEAVDAGKAHAEKDGVEIGGEFAEREIATEHLAGADFDAADSGHVFHFAAREVVGRLVGGDAVFIEAAGLFTRVEDN